jgi:hypothetical protein
MNFTLDAETVLGDRYRLIERIAAGGQAEDTALGRPAVGATRRARG